MVADYYFLITTGTLQKSRQFSITYLSQGYHISCSEASHQGILSVYHNQLLWGFNLMSIFNLLQLYLVNTIFCCPRIYRRKETALCKTGPAWRSWQCLGWRPTRGTACTTPWSTVRSSSCPSWSSSSATSGYTPLSHCEYWRWMQNIKMHFYFMH